MSNYSESRWHFGLFDLSDLLYRLSTPDALAVWGRNNLHRRGSHSESSQALISNAFASRNGNPIISPVMAS